MNDTTVPTADIHAERDDLRARIAAIDEAVSDSRAEWYALQPETIQKILYANDGDTPSDALARVRAQAGAAALREAAEALDLPGTEATGYYASESVTGYNEAERDAEQWLRARADRVERGKA